MAISDEEFEAANERGREMLKGPRVVQARYDRPSNRIELIMTTGYGIFFAPSQSQELEHATPDELEQIEITPSGLGIHFPKIDGDIYIPALMEGVWGTKSWTAAQMGAAGGAMKTVAKAEAARKNGARGGRPRKTPAAYPG